MRIVLIGFLYIVFMLFGCPTWLGAGCAPYLVRALTYSFFHASILHLAINGLSLWAVFPGRDKGREIRLLLAAYLIAVAVYPLGRPCVGISNVLFAACGMRLKPSWLKSANGILFLVLMLGMCFLPQFAGTQHLAAFFIGMLLERMYDSLDTLRRDVRRYTADR